MVRPDLLHEQLVDAGLGVLMQGRHVGVEVGADRRRRRSGVTSSDACSKCDGVGRTCASSPGSASFGHSAMHGALRLILVGQKQTLVPP